MKRRSVDYEVLSKLYFRLLPYQVLLLVINAANGIVDSLFAGNFVGRTAMSAIGFYAPVNHFLFAVSILLVSGSQLLVGKSMGGNHMEELRGYFSTDLVLSACAGVLTAALLGLCAVLDLTRGLVADAVEREALNRYVLGQAPGIPALVLGQQLFSFLSMENRRKRTTAASIACVAANIAMNTLFVSVLKMGTLGLGLGSSAGLWAFFLVMAACYVSGKTQLRFSLRAVRRQDVPAIVRQGYPGAISRFLEMFRCFIVNMLILRWVGSVGLSAFAASNSVMAVFWPIPFGMIAVTRMLLGVCIGEEDRKSVADIMRLVTGRCVQLQCAVAALIVIFAVPFTRMFYRDPSDPVYQMTVMGLRLLPLCMPLAVISLNFACYAQAAKKRALAHVLPTVDGLLGVVGSSLVLIPALGMNGLYLANILNGVLCLLVVIAYAASVCRRFPRNMEELLALPDGFGVSEEARVDIEVRDIGEVLSVSGRVIAFCERRGIDRRRAAFAGLALEEMAGNVVEHGFAKDQKRHAVDIRVVHKGDDVILRLRDDCIPFDPLERTSLLEPGGDPAANVGIRIVRGLARDICYQNILGLNVLTVRI